MELKCSRIRRNRKKGLYEVRDGEKGMSPNEYVISEFKLMTKERVRKATRKMGE